MQQYPDRPAQPLPAPDTELIVGQLRAVVGALSIIAGLIGALAVHIIFVGDFLPSIPTQNSIDPEAAAAISDLLGFALFYALAAMAGRPLVAHSRGRRSTRMSSWVVAQLEVRRRLGRRHSSERQNQVEVFG